MSCQCFEQNPGIWFKISIIGLIATCALFFAHGVPLFHKYLQEERHHVSKTYALKSVDDSETRSCTYRYQRNCRAKSGTCEIDEIRRRGYVCLNVLVSYEDGNKPMMDAQLFRSFRDAKRTDYQCAAYECEHSGDVVEYGENLKKMDSIKCFTNPNQPQYVYMQSSADNAGWIVFFFSFELILLLVMIVVLLCLIVRCRAMSQHRRRKASEVVEIDEKGIALTSNLPSS